MRQIFSIITLIILFIECKDKNNCVNILPNRPVDISFSLNLPDGIDLQNKGYIIKENQGIKGVIIYKSLDGYKAYDLASPHLSPDDKNSRLILTPDGFQLKNTSDGAIFLLNTGQSLNNKSLCPLKEYPVILGNNTISVNN